MRTQLSRTPPPFLLKYHKRIHEHFAPHVHPPWQGFLASLGSSPAKVVRQKNSNNWPNITIQIKLYIGAASPVTTAINPGREMLAYFRGLFGALCELFGSTRRQRPMCPSSAIADGISWSACGDHTIFRDEIPLTSGRIRGSPLTTLNALRSFTIVRRGLYLVPWTSAVWSLTHCGNLSCASTVGPHHRRQACSYGRPMAPSDPWSR